MGLDLTLLPAYSENMDFTFTLDVLEFKRNYKLFDSLKDKLDQFGVEVKEGIDTFKSNNKYEDYHYGLTKTDAYGNTLKYLTANHLKDTIKIFPETSWKNRAIYAFINELPDELPIYLFWH